MELQRNAGLWDRRRVTHTVMAVMLAFYLFLAWSTPYSAIDDLEWGLDVGVHWLRDGSLNSRYVGNFFAVIMCRSPLVKTLILGLSTFFIPVLTAKLTPLGGGGRNTLPRSFRPTWPVTPACSSSPPPCGGRPSPGCAASATTGYPLCCFCSGW